MDVRQRRRPDIQSRRRRQILRRRFSALNNVSLDVGSRRVSDSARAVRLWKDDTVPDAARRLRAARRAAASSARGRTSPPKPARRRGLVRHGVSGLRAFPAYVGRTKHRAFRLQVRKTPARRYVARRVAEMIDRVGLERPRAQAARKTLRRPATAGRAGARVDLRTAGAAARRAVLCARQAPARTACRTR